MHPVGPPKPLIELIGKPIGFSTSACLVQGHLISSSVPFILCSQLAIAAHDHVPVTCHCNEHSKAQLACSTTPPSQAPANTSHANLQDPSVGQHPWMSEATMQLLIKGSNCGKHGRPMLPALQKPATEQHSLHLLTLSTTAQFTPQHAQRGHTLSLQMPLAAANPRQNPS